MKQNDLTKGNIMPVLLKLALPIMGTSFIQMAYNMADVFWIGKLGSKASTAVSAAGFFMWFAMGIIMIPKVSAESLVSQAVGRKDENTNIIVGTIIKFTLLVSLLYGCIIFFGRNFLIGVFNIDNAEVVSMALQYSKIISLSYLLFFFNPVLSAIFNAYGSSKIPFLFNTCGLVLNIILDPILIFGIVGKPLGVLGAAFATVISQLLVTILFLFYILKAKDTILFKGFKLFRMPDLYKLKNILKVGTPVGLQAMSFTIIATFIVRIITQYGYLGVGVQRIGSQIEAVTWMTASGFSVAISTFIGQNLGAKQYKRIDTGFKVAYVSMLIVGLFTSFALVLFPKEIFGAFLNEPEALKEGAIYLSILGYSQVFMCVEIVTNGAFYGLGKTMYPSVNSTVLTAARIPLAYILSRFLGLSGVWWAISITSMIKGVLITILYFKKGRLKIEAFSPISTGVAE
ncbi:MAG: MATE family efflux transporter [Treponema sp.]|nr:MAG: MATE family efflux transporter [Treponema sp.]